MWKEYFNNLLGREWLIAPYLRARKFQDWHPAPRRQYVVTLSGRAEVRIYDGASRVLSQGDVMLADDLTGQGHTTGNGGDEPWVYLTIQLT
ncbi:MAG: cupin domain-containing protein [Chloroflexi bacterium]|nr:cupin domain-containing protein [Chloroflexota bacterium]